MTRLHLTRNLRILIELMEAQMKPEAFEEILSQIISNIEDLKSDYSKLRTHPLLYVRELHRQITSMLEDDLGDHKGSIACEGCRKGCCCYVNVSVLYEEVLYLAHLFFPDGDLRRFLGEEAFARLSRQNAILAPCGTPESCLETFERLAVADRRCVFLAEDNSCRIYDARPLRCRTFNLKYTSEHCTVEFDSDLMTRIIGVNAEVVLSATIDQEAMSLPVALMNYIGGNNHDNYKGGPPKIPGGPTDITIET